MKVDVIKPDAPPPPPDEVLIKATMFEARLIKKALWVVLGRDILTVTERGKLRHLVGDFEKDGDKGVQYTHGTGE